MSSLLDDTAALNQGSAEQYISYSRLCDKWESVKIPYYGPGMGSAWVCEVSQEEEHFDGPNPGPGAMFIIIEADGYSHS